MLQVAALKCGLFERLARQQARLQQAGCGEPDGAVVREQAALCGRWLVGLFPEQASAARERPLLALHLSMGSKAVRQLGDLKMGSLECWAR